MEYKLNAIEQKIDGVSRTLDEVAVLVKGWSPREAKEILSEIMKDVDRAQKQWILTADVVRKMSGNDKDREEYDVKQAAAWLLIGEQHMRKLLRDGEVHGEKTGGAGDKGEWRIKHDALVEYKNNRRKLKGSSQIPPESPAE